MSIFVNGSTRLCVQGITGRDGMFHARAMIDYGTNVVCGVTPGKGGQQMDGVPVFNTMGEAVQETGANASITFVPARFAADAILEAAEAGVTLLEVDGHGFGHGDLEGGLVSVGDGLHGVTSSARRRFAAASRRPSAAPSRGPAG